MDKVKQGSRKNFKFCVKEMEIRGRPPIQKKAGR